MEFISMLVIQVFLTVKGLGYATHSRTFSTLTRHTFATVLINNSSSYGSI